MRSVAIIQTRMNSARLPGKVMLDLCGKSILSHVVGRVQACEAIDEVVVATTKNASDQRIVAEAKNLGAGVYCGRKNNVFDQYYAAVKKLDTKKLFHK